jgi:hypothetical protein
MSDAGLADVDDTASLRITAVSSEALAELRKAGAVGRFSAASLISSAGIVRSFDIRQNDVGTA